MRATTCGRKEVFAELQEHTCGPVSLGDNSKLTVVGKGKVAIYQKNGTMTFISDVYYVPSMKSNILSLEQLLQKGHVIHLENNFLELRDPQGRIIDRVRMTKNRMFPLYLNSKSECCLVGPINSETEKWHLRFGHLHFHGLKLLSTKGMVQGLPNLKMTEYVCATCVLSKQARLAFPVRVSRRAQHLDNSYTLTFVGHLNLYL